MSRLKQLWVPGKIGPKKYQAQFFLKPKPNFFFLNFSLTYIFMSVATPSFLSSLSSVLVFVFCSFFPFPSLFFFFFNLFFITPYFFCQKKFKFSQWDFLFTIYLQLILISLKRISFV